MTKDEKFLELARKRWTLAEDADKNQRIRELEDLRFYSGGRGQWDDKIWEARQAKTVNGQNIPAQPCITINKTLEPVRQVLNQQRQSDLGYELVPADDFGEASGPVDHTEIELREGLVRRIQRDPEAEDARTWSFTRAAIAGRGYRVVLTRYLPGKRSDQEIYIDRIYNQNSVALDPSREQPDGSDMDWGFYGTDMLWSTFKSEHPGAKAAKADTDSKWRQLGDEAPGWFKQEGDVRSVRVVNYYYTERESKELYHLSDGSAAYDEELSEVAKDAPRVLTSNPQVYVLEDDGGEEECHTEVVKSIKWAKITGIDVLETTDVPCPWIPIIEEVGEELQPYDGERRKQGVVRPMTDACKGFNYIASKFVSRVGLAPNPSWMMAGGQDEGYAEEYNAANTRAIGVLHYNQVDDFQRPAPPPFRADVRSEVSDLAMGIQMFGQAIQSTSVVPETALGNTDPTVKSGKLARALIEQGEQGTSNFMDNHKRSLRHEARVVNAMLYPIYGGRIGRMVRMVNGQGDVESVIIGQPFQMQGTGRQKRPVPVQVQDGQPLPQNAKLYKLTPDANFNVAVKISKSIETRRQQIVQFLGELVGSDPAQMLVIGDLLWKYLDVPEHAQIEERYKLMLAPPIQQLLSGNTPLSPEAQQKIAMLEAQLQELMPLADKNKTDLMKAQGQSVAENERTKAELESKEKIEKWKLEVQLEIEMAKLGNAEMMKRAEIDADLLHQHNEAQLAEQERADALASDAALTEQENANTQAQTTQEGEQAMMQAEQGQQHALEQGDQANQAAIQQGQLSHEQALEQQAAKPQSEGGA